MRAFSPTEHASPVSGLNKIPILKGVIPDLPVVEEMVGRHPGLTISVYDPNASPKTPWLWLQNDVGVYKIYTLMDACELAKYLYQVSARGAGQAGQYSFVRKQRVTPVFKK